MESRDTYRSSCTISEEYGVMDLHIGTIIGIDSAPLKVVHVPRRDIEKFQEISGDENYGTHLSRCIRDETRGMDLHNGTVESSNSSALKVVYAPPGIRAKI
jgi:hypothetical protein